MNIHEELLDTVFAYRAPTNQEKNMIKLDENCVMYNNLYKSFGFYEAKFPAGYDNIPGFEQVIENIVEHSQNKTPLDELLARLN